MVPNCVLKCLETFAKSTELKISFCNHYAASNPVERHNKTIKIALSQYSKDDHRDWDIYLPFVTFAINTS